MEIAELSFHDKVQLVLMVIFLVTLIGFVYYFSKYQYIRLQNIKLKHKLSGVGNNTNLVVKLHNKVLFKECKRLQDKCNSLSLRLLEMANKEGLSRKEATEYFASFGIDVKQEE